MSPNSLRYVFYHVIGCVYGGSPRSSTIYMSYYQFDQGVRSRFRVPYLGFFFGLYANLISRLGRVRVRRFRASVSATCLEDFCRVLNGYLRAVYFFFRGLGVVPSLQVLGVLSLWGIRVVGS